MRDRTGEVMFALLIIVGLEEMLRIEKRMADVEAKVQHQPKETCEAVIKYLISHKGSGNYFPKK